MADSFEARLTAAGVEADFVDGFGQRRAVSRDTLERIVELLPTDAPRAAEEPEAARCYLPAPLREKRRLWGLAAQVYAIRSERNWGVGDFTDLARLGEMAAALGASFVAVNPLHARSFAEPALCSPYSPTSRYFIDPLYIDPGAVEEYRASPMLANAIRIDTESQRKLLCGTALIDYEQSNRLKLDTLLRLYGHFKDCEQAHDTARARDFDSFVTNRGEPLQHYAAFEARRLARRSGDTSEADLAGFHCYVQWIAEQQLADAAARLRGAGMSIGLYLDLALGPALSGAETNNPACAMIDGVSAGAPPDAFNPQGQFWNLAVSDPHQLARTGARTFADLLRANMRYAGALRLDHVMGLRRLFWALASEAGIDGTYVAYPFELLAEVLAQVSNEQQCLVVGEDLGTVPHGFREALAARNILGCRVLWFERDATGRFLDARQYPHHSLVSAATHDTPTIAGYWSGRDIEIRRDLGLFDDESSLQNARRERRDARLSLAHTLGLSHSVAPQIESGDLPPGLGHLIYMHLARSPAALLQIQMDDVLECADPINVPGTTDGQFPNWRRKLPVSLERLGADARFAKLRDLSTARSDGIRD